MAAVDVDQLRRDIVAALEGTAVRGWGEVVADILIAGPLRPLLASGIVPPPSGLFAFGIPVDYPPAPWTYATVRGRIIVGSEPQMAALALGSWRVVPVVDDVAPTVTVDEWAGATGLVWHRELGRWVPSETMRYGISKLAAEHDAQQAAG